MKLSISMPDELVAHLDEVAPHGRSEAIARCVDWMLCLAAAGPKDRPTLASHFAGQIGARREAVTKWRTEQA